MPRRPEPTTLRLAAIKAVGRWPTQNIHKKTSFRQKNVHFSHWIQVRFFGKSTFLIWNIQAPGENLLWVQKFSWGGKSFLKRNQTIFVLEHEKTSCPYLNQNCSSVPGTHRKWSFLERWRSFCELAPLAAGRPFGRGTFKFTFPLHKI